MYLNGEGDYIAYYPGGDKSEEMVQIEAYKAPLKDLYIHDDGKGNLTVVDANGKPVDSPPVVYLNGEGDYIAYYPGMYNEDGSQIPVGLPTYKAPLKDLYIHDDGKGNITVVDANGKPVDSPPVVYLNGEGDYSAYYPGMYNEDGSQIPVSLPTYKAPLKDLYIHDDGKGNITVVDANGKAVNSPPIVYADGEGNYSAYYPGGDKSGKTVYMEFYKPSSKHSRGTL